VIYSVPSLLTRRTTATALAAKPKRRQGGCGGEGLLAMQTTGEFLLFSLGSLSAALIGWGIVVVTSRIEHQRQERYLTRHGTDPVPKAR
jgi:hypothetical protein